MPLLVAGSTLAGVALQWWLSAQQAAGERKRATETARLERIAQVLGPVQTLLIDLLPERAMFNSTAGSMGQHRTQRWQPLRGPWEAALVMEPSRVVRGAMRELEVTIENIYNRLSLAVSPSASERDYYDEASTLHARAMRLAEQIAASLHADDVEISHRSPPELSE